MGVWTALMWHTFIVIGVLIAGQWNDAYHGKWLFLTPCSHATCFKKRT